MEGSSQTCAPSPVLALLFGAGLSNASKHPRKIHFFIRFGLK
jgi:hypothetical protein